MNTQQMASTRSAFVEELMELAAEDSRIALVCADSLKAARATPFAERYPDRLFDVGICEQHAMGFAAGLAACGVKPFFNTYAGFITMRACEQLRTFVAYPRLNVKVVGLNGGIYGGEREGVTHQFFEDLGIVRSIPGIEIVVPADAGQTRKATKALAAREGPAYLRIGSGREPVIFDDAMPFEFGKARIIQEYGTDAVLFTNGPILYRVLQAAKDLEAAGVKVMVVEVHTLKPLDVETITTVLQCAKLAVTIEDHNIIGALGSAVAEVIAEHAPAHLVRIGLQDIFPISGAAEEVLDYFGMGVHDMVEIVKKEVSQF